MLLSGWCSYSNYFSFLVDFIMVPYGYMSQFWHTLCISLSFVLVFTCTAVEGKSATDMVVRGRVVGRLFLHWPWMSGCERRGPATGCTFNTHRTLPVVRSGGRYVPSWDRRAAVGASCTRSAAHIYAG